MGQNSTINFFKISYALYKKNCKPRTNCETYFFMILDLIFKHILVLRQLLKIISIFKHHALTSENKILGIKPMSDNKIFC